MWNTEDTRLWRYISFILTCNRPQLYILRVPGQHTLMEVNLWTDTERTQNPQSWILMVVVVVCFPLPFLNFIRFVLQNLNAVLTTINDLPCKEPNLPHAQSTTHKRTINISQYINASTHTPTHTHTHTVAEYINLLAP